MYIATVKLRCSEGSIHKTYDVIWGIDHQSTLCGPTRIIGEAGVVKYKVSCGSQIDCGLHDKESDHCRAMPPTLNVV